MQKRRKHRARSAGALLCAAALLASAALTAFFLIAGYGAILDSDMASELTFCRHLLDRGVPVSRTWYHSTELRLLGTQLVYTPLMALFPHDWRLVRTLGSGILVALLGAASYWCARSFGARRRYAALSAALTVCVGSPVYAEFVIVGCCYVPHALFPMLAAGLYARWLRGRGRMRALGLGLLLLAACMGSVRYVVTVGMPLAAAALWAFVFPNGGGGKKTLDRREDARDLRMALAALAACAAGYLIADKLLSRVLHGSFDYYGGVAYADWGAKDMFGVLQSALSGLLGVAGFEGGVPLFGGQGIVNALVLLSLFAGAPLLVRALRRGDRTLRFGALMLVFSGALSLAAFVLLSALYFDRYWISVTALGVPVIFACLSAEDNVPLRRMAALLFAAACLLTSLSCVRYAMKNPEVERDMRGVAIDAIRERGLDKGYATFWNANIVTELSNGEIDVVSVAKTVRDGETTLEPYRWLEAEEDFLLDRPDEPVFLLLGTWESDGMDGFLARAGAQRVALEGYIDLYLIPSQRAFFEAMEPSGGEG